VGYLKFVYGKKQKAESVDLDKLFTDLQTVLGKHPIVPAANIDAIVSEWINDLLFVAGKITEEDLQEAMQTFESVEAAAAANESKPGKPGKAGKVAVSEDEVDEEDDEDDEDDEDED
jgi:ribosomal protein L12E/L44/L45/RPP1/RPP2